MRLVCAQGGTFELKIAALSHDRQRAALLANPRLAPLLSSEAQMLTLHIVQES